MRQRGKIWGLLLTLTAAAAVLWPGDRALPASNDIRGEVEVPEKLVALTFDDGPRRTTTAALLDGLAQRGVRATFFLVGTCAAVNQDLVERMAQEGHQIGVHTFDHVLVAGLDEQSFTEQVEGTRQALYSILGERELWLRPPYGILDENVKKWADSPIVLWSVDPEDWKDCDVQRITSHILNHTGEGDIILMHDIYPSSVQAALAVVDAMQAQGYRFVTVAELLEKRGVQTQSGQVYSKG